MNSGRTAPTIADADTLARYGAVHLGTATTGKVASTPTISKSKAIAHVAQAAAVGDGAAMVASNASAVTGIESVCSTTGISVNGWNVLTSKGAISSEPEKAAMR